MDAAWTGTKVLVTGATGFIGSALCRRLTNVGAEIHAISRFPHTNGGGRIRWWQGDLANIDTVRGLMDEVKPQILFHLSGMATATPDIKAVLPTFHSLLTSTVNLLVAASETRCERFVMAGSCDESTPDGETPSSPYVAAKTASTAYGNMFHKLYRVPVVTLRVFMAYGPGQNEKKLIPYVVRSLLNGKPPKLASGKQQIDWVHIDDVVAGFMAAAKAPGLEGNTIDLGSGTLTTIKEVVEQAALIIGSKAEPMFGARPDRPLLPTPRSAKLEESAALLGWRPTVSLQEGLRRTVHWHRNQINSVFAAALALISLVESA